MSEKKTKKGNPKLEIPGIADELLNKIKKEEQKKFISLMARLYLRSSEEVLIEEIFRKAYRTFIREKLFNDGVLDEIVRYSYDNDLNSFNKDGTINRHLVEHVLENTKEDYVLHRYIVENNVVK